MENSDGGNSSSANPKLLSGEALKIFGEGIYLILSKWSALQLAVENEWGGRNSRRIGEQLVSDIFSWFTQSKEPLYIDDLEGMLDEAMLSLSTMADDGSIEEVAEKLMIMHEECLEGNFNSVEKLREIKFVAHAHVRQAVNDEDEEEDNSEDDDVNNDRMATENFSNTRVDLPKSQSNSDTTSMAVDEPRPNGVGEAEGGWTVVASRRGKGRRN